MQRVQTQRQAEIIAITLEALPGGVGYWLLDEAHVFCGNAVFSGLHEQRTDLLGRSFSDIAHVSFSWNSRYPKEPHTLVFPNDHDMEWEVIVHEAGHVLHDWLGWPSVKSYVTEYSRLDSWGMEQFAEAFTAYTYLKWCPTWQYGTSPLSNDDYLLFESLVN